MRFLAAAIFAAALSGCSLVEDVIVIERPRQEAAAQGPAPGASKGQAPAALNAADVSKASSARHDSAPVLRPIRKTPEEKPEDEAEESAFAAAVKSFLRAGLHLPGWAGR